MEYTLQQALALIDTEGFTDVDGLRRLVASTSIVPTNVATDASLLLYGGPTGGVNVGGALTDAYATWQVAVPLSDSSVGADGLKRLVTFAQGTPRVVYPLDALRSTASALIPAFAGMTGCVAAPGPLAA